MHQPKESQDMCTTLLVGKNASNNGAFFVARSADSSSLKAQHFVFHPAKEGQSGTYRTADYNGANNFEHPLPETSFAYTTVPNWKTQLHGAVGFNEKGLGITGTESIFASDAALAVDPYNAESGITEDDVLDVLLCRCSTAREACAYLGSIIEETGAGEGFGVAFVDADECWYLETGSGHQWMAQKLADDVYFASGNQGRLKAYDPECPDMMASKTLVSFAKENGLFTGDFDFAAAYTRDDGRDRIYNDPRVWVMQKMFNPSLEQAPDAGRTFPVFLAPEKKITLNDVRAAMRDHFEGTSHDPYGERLRGDEPWRPISVFRTYEAHVMEVRPELPKEIGEIVHVAWGMADLSVFLPFYQGLKSLPECYTKGTDVYSEDSTYWHYRRIQTLAMTNYDVYAPIVKEAFRALEAEMDAKREVFEAQYMLLTDDEVKCRMLNDFNLGLLDKAYKTADQLFARLMTLKTAEIEESVVFKNNKSKD